MAPEQVPGWPGVGLSDEEMRKEVASVEWAPRIKYAWAAGEAMSRFLAELEAGRFIARHCKTCDTLLFPPRMFCEECYRPTDAWVPVRDTGTVETFSVSFLDMDARRVKDPIFVGVVILDGPEYRAPETGRPRMGLMHYFGEIKKDSKAQYGFDLRIGQRVKAVWKPTAERKGSILDVKYFRPLRAEEDPFAAKGGESVKRPAKRAATSTPKGGGR